MHVDKIENFNYLNVAFISYKLTMWDCMLISVGRKVSGQCIRKIDIYSSDLNGSHIVSL